MPWLRLRLATDARQAERLEEQLQSAGAVAVSLLPISTEDADEGEGVAPAVVVEPAPGETPLWRNVRVEALLPVDTALGALPTHRFELDFLADEDWSATWRRAWAPLRFGRLVVRSKGQDAIGRQRPAKAGGEDVPLRLDPGLAFGTGTHPTTALCLAWLAEQSLCEQRILDVGSGSGILAIAALLLGAKTALGVDHDPQALRAAAENARENGVSLPLAASLDQVPGRFNIALANIVANTLCDMASALTERAETVVLSGILEAQTERVMNAFPAFEFQSPIAKDGWVLLVGRHVAGRHV